ncbi:hypothetical protein HPB48_017973 [Haemaphysalis longicornis]|uniref:Peptidase M13 C-terminal domain-containing protein n=1 Tax=Haemaphysalis longicornis TaxID=44386 RepID=A0A9J6FS61_HAELO|nr:hypothetical protein HPB48_017973 [Haemaphysalis longicornis]
MAYVNHVLLYGVLKLQLNDVLTDSAIRYTRTLMDALRRELEISFNFSSLNEKSSEGVVRRLKIIHEIISGPTKLLTTPALDEHYRHVPRVDRKNFLHWLVDSYRSVAERNIRLIYPPGHPDHLPATRDDFALADASANAYYLPAYHLIYVPGSILLPPFLTAVVPDAFNYGALGKVLAHELTHAFEPESLDVNYAVEPDLMYTPRLKDKVQKQYDCLLIQAGALAGNAFADRRTASETFADNAGTELAYLTYSALAEAKRSKGVAGLTPDQTFFAATCFIFCGADDQKEVRSKAYLPLKLRCNQPLLNTEQFASAFRCARGAPMRPSTRCDIHTTRVVSRR